MPSDEKFATIVDMQWQRQTFWRGFAGLFSLFLAIVLTACATTAPYTPSRLITPDELSGVQTKTVDDVTVSVAILSDEEARAHFGADLGKQGLQTLWLSVRNGLPGKLWFIRNILDRDFYSPDEAAILMQGEVAEPAFDTLRQHFRDESIRVLMMPGTITEGFVFLPRKEGGRYIDVRLAGDVYDMSELNSGVSADAVKRSGGTVLDFRFGFALPLPDGDFDYERLETAKTYAGEILPDLDTEAFRLALERLPCCVTDADNEQNGDPLNVVIVGESADLLNSLSRSGWSFTHRITLRSVGRLVGAALQGEAYPVAPVSSLYVFGRKQDFALQRARRSIARRNHMRFWLAPFTYQGKQVWVGQISRDIGIKLSRESPSLTTHIIDPEVDLAREYLLHSLLAEGLVERFGFVKGSVAAPRTQPASNLTGDPFFSDGMRLVVILSPDPQPLVEVGSLRWERSSPPVAEGQTEAAERNVRPISPKSRESD